MSPSVLLLALALQGPADRPAATDPKFPYWQQAVSYDITARLDEQAGVLAGREAIRYVNHSPDTLTTFSLHLYLNAFRPGSRWADADSAEGRRRFNDLKDPDYALNHVRNVRIMGQAVQAVYPFAPDSTIVRFELPRPLAPGDTMTVDMDWDARPSTTPRRQGRRGRRFDFAQWYPKVVVYDKHGWQEHPVYPAGEFYGEFGDFLVQLDVPEDQVVGSTGVALCGDPGWEKNNRSAGQPIDYQRDYYGALAPAGAAGRCTGAEAGYKRIVWYARDVHHFAMSLNPDYRYEGGRYGDVAVHVLYQPGDEKTWGGGVAVKRTETALAWLDQLFGKFSWPQITNVHRIEGGGTEFPMMIHDGSADQGLIVHELGHNYVMGQLANNEWREGFLDEGFTSFQTTWFWEQQGRLGGYEGTESGILMLDLDDYSEPTSLVSEAYRDFNTYNTMIYGRGELFFHQLRYIVGDETMHRILRTYFERWKLKHVDEAAFKAVAEEVSKQDLSTFFGQFLHSTELYDYGIGRVRTRRAGDGWTTRVEVTRHAPGRIPVEVAVLSDRDTVLVRTEGLAEREWVEVATQGKPRRILVDPRVRTHDWNMLNNERRLGFDPVWTLLNNRTPTTHYLDTWFSTKEARDRKTVGWMPTAWYNDAGGLTFGLRAKDDYLGRFEQNQLLVSGSTGLANPAAEPDVKKLDVLARLKNPVWLRSPNMSQTIEGFQIEGRYGARLAVDWTRQEHLGFGAVKTVGLALQWVRADDMRYLDPGFYQPVGTVELAWSAGVRKRSGAWQVGLTSALTGGLVYGDRVVLPQPAGTGTSSELYGRFDVTGTARRNLGKGFALGLRAAGTALANRDDVPQQRRVYLAGADPYQNLYNPFLRSRGALLVRPKEYYNAPGGLGLRGFDPHVTSTYGVGVTAELEKSLLTAPRRRLFSRVALAAFGDAAVADVPLGVDDDKAHLFADAGVGLRAEHRIGDTRFVTRFDLPLFVSRPALAQDQHPGTDKVGFRWLFSFSPAI